MYGIQIAALGKICFTGEGHLTEHRSGLTFFWSGHGADEHHISDVGFAVRTPLYPSSQAFPKD